MSNNNNNDKVNTIGCKKVIKSTKEFRCCKCEKTIPVGSTYYRLFLSKNKHRCELFFCDSCGGEGKTVIIK